MEYINIEPLGNAALSEFRNFARIDAVQDASQMACLLDALLRVQEMADRPLVSCTVRIRAKADRHNRVRLYLGAPTQITSVVDELGNDIPYVVFEGVNEIGVDEGERVAVTYTVNADANAFRSLKIYVFQLASAIYDGNDEEQDRILSTIPTSLIC